MAEHTQLERDVVLRWLRDHYEDKDLVHWYLQRIAFEVRCTNPTYRGKTVSMKDVETVFLDETVPVTKMDKETATELSKQKWFGITGFKKGK